MLEEFDLLLERLLPSTAESKVQRAGAAEKLNARYDAIRASAWYGQTANRLTGSEREFTNHVHALADTFTKAFAAADANPAGEPGLNEALEAAIAALADEHALRASYPGSSGETLWNGAFLAWMLLGMSGAVASLGVIITDAFGLRGVVVDHTVSILASITGGTMLGLGALATTDRGRRVLIRGSDRQMFRGQASERLHQAFWARVRDLMDHPHLEAYLPTAARSDLAAHVLSRINLLGPSVATAACTRWLSSSETWSEPGGG